MVEVPATAVMAAQFAKEADFFSIGTERPHAIHARDGSRTPEARAAVDGLSPAVLHLIAHTVRGAHAAAAVGVCGGIASDSAGVPIPRRPRVG
jgi:phosphocarrier protein FPr